MVSYGQRTLDWPSLARLAQDLPLLWGQRAIRRNQMQVEMDFQALAPRCRTRTILEARADKEPLVAVQRVQWRQRHILKHEHFVPRPSRHLHADDFSRELIGHAARTRFGCLDGGSVDGLWTVQRGLGCVDQVACPDHQCSRHQKQIQ